MKMRAALLAGVITIMMPGYARAAGSSCDSLLKLALEQSIRQVPVWSL
jgi:hypothetical protein